MAADHADVVKKALELKKIGNDLVTLVGGREIHPINVSVGGFYRVPAERELAPLAERLKRALEPRRSRRCASPPALDVPRLRAGLRVRLAAPPRRVPVQRGADRLEQGARHPGLRVRGPLHRGARRRTRTRCTRVHKGHGRLPRGPARALQPELRPAARGSRRRRRGPRASAPPAATRSRASWSARSSSSSPATRRCASSTPTSRRTGPPWTSCRATATGHGATEAPRGMLYHRYRIDAKGLVQAAKIVPPDLAEPEDDRERPLALRADRPRPAEGRAHLEVRAGHPQLRPLHLLRDALPEAGPAARSDGLPEARAVDVGRRGDLGGLRPRGRPLATAWPYDRPARPGRSATGARDVASSIGVGNPYRGRRRRRQSRRAAAPRPETIAPSSVRECTGEATALMNAWTGFDDVVLVDACRGAGPAGSVHRIGPDDVERVARLQHASTHSLGVAAAIGLARALGTLPSTPRHLRASRRVIRARARASRRRWIMRFTRSWH